MSFSTDIKEELCRIRVKGEEQRRALLAGLTQTCASLRLSRTPQVFYQSESASVVRLIAQLVGSLYALDATSARREQEHRKAPLSVVTFSGADCRKLLVDAGVLSEQAGALSFIKQIPAALVSDPECRRAFLRGAFLGSGSCSDPASGYHLEIVCRTDAFAGELVQQIGSLGPVAKRTERKGRDIVYLKGDDVAGFLALTGERAYRTGFPQLHQPYQQLRNRQHRQDRCRRIAAAERD